MTNTAVEKDKPKEPKAAHTPGPWEVHEGIDYIHIYGGSHDHSGSPIAEVTEIEDANFIAAAPEMLAALKEADRVICSALDAAGYDVLYKSASEREAAHAEHVTIKVIRAAILKAGGAA